MNTNCCYCFISLPILLPAVYVYVYVCLYLFVLVGFIEILNFNIYGRTNNKSLNSIVNLMEKF